MTGETTERLREGSTLVLDALDSDSAGRIDRHLRRAEKAEEDDEKDFHVRHARQLLEACKKT